MRNQSLLIAAALLSILHSSPAKAETASPAPSPQENSATKSPASSPVPTATSAPFKQRLAAAKSVKVMTSILGLELGSSLEKAHAKLDKLTDPAHPLKEEAEKGGGEGERKVLWQLQGTDYSAIFVESEKEGIKLITGMLRSGKEIPFEKIGEIKKAPIQNDNMIAWDVVRPKKPLFRVTATGPERKAKSISIFVVKRRHLQTPGPD